jgi:hypothetical protein
VERGRLKRLVPETLPGVGRTNSARGDSWFRGSVAAAVALLFCALVPGRVGFAIGVLAMQLASYFMLYSTAFVEIVCNWAEAMHSAASRISP